MDHGRIGYETLLSGQGTRAGSATSSVRYRLRHGLEAIDAHGTVKVAASGSSSPLCAREVNLYGQLEDDDKRLRDCIGLTDTRSDRHLVDWTLSLNGDLRNAVLNASLTSCGSRPRSALSRRFSASSRPRVAGSA